MELILETLGYLGTIALGGLIVLGFVVLSKLIKKIK